MTDHTADLSPRRAAKVAGFGYLIIIITGLLAEFFVRSRLIVWSDAAATANNILTSGGLFRLGISSELVMLACDAVVAVALYALLRPVNKTLALLAASFRLIHTAISGINLLNLVKVLLLLSGAGYLKALEPNQVSAQIMLFLNAHNFGYLIALVFFAFHCLILGYLIFKSSYIPGILGVLLILASFGYLTDSFAKILLVNYADYATVFLLIVAVPAIVAELSFCFWLLFRGGKIQLKVS